MAKVNEYEFGKRVNMASFLNELVSVCKEKQERLTDYTGSELFGEILKHHNGGDHLLGYCQEVGYVQEKSGFHDLYEMNRWTDERAVHGLSPWAIPNRVKFNAWLTPARLSRTKIDAAMYPDVRNPDVMDLMNYWAVLAQIFSTRGVAI